MEICDVINSTEDGYVTKLFVICLFASRKTDYFTFLAQKKLKKYMFALCKRTLQLSKNVCFYFYTD